MNYINHEAEGRNLCRILVMNRLKAQLGIHVLRYEKDSRKRNSMLVTIVAVIFCMIMGAGYCAGMAYGYAYIGLAGLIPGIALVISSIVTLFYTMFSANGELFGFKDYELVMSLPIPVRTIINSRLINMYIWNTFFTLLVMVPMGIIYALFAVPPVGFYIIWIAGIFLASLIPTVAAALIGAVITAVSSKFRYPSAISTILSILAVILLLVFSTASTVNNAGPGKLFDAETGNINEEAFTAIAPAISNTLNRLYPPARLFTEAATGGNIIAFLLFMMISIGFYALFVLVLSSKYRQIRTALTSHRSRADYRLETLQQGSMLFALYRKTIMRILKSTICATNLLIGCILALLFAAAMTIVGPEKVLGSLQIGSMQISEFTNTMKSIAYYIIAAMICMTNTAAVSLALEGKSIWIIKSLPIPPKTLYDSYLMTNLTFTVPTSVICSVLFCVSLKTSFTETIIMVLTPLAFALFTATAGIFIGNRMAYYNWQDETQLVKQSMMSFLGVMGGFALTFLCGLIANTGILPISANMITLIFNILLLILAALIYRNEINRPIKE